MSEVFLVGGAVRDMLMGKTPKDFDFVVVGHSPSDMLELGFEQVGKDFPVFLHPKTGEEFALARTERKMGHGHTGFECNWDGVTLEQDLERRDLTVNAMAIEMGTLSESFNALNVMTCGQMLEHGLVKVEHCDIIDLFGGEQDIEDKRLCIVGEHFREDPLRVLRVARFLARFGEDWVVDPRSFAMCAAMIKHGELNSLTPERVWKEMSRALMEDTPSMFFNFLHVLRWNGIKELSDLEGALQRPDFHPEGDSLVHTLQCLDRSADARDSLVCRFATLCHDFGKWPAFVENTARGEKHLGGHESKGLPLIAAFCDRWKVPNDCRGWATHVARDHTNVHNLHRLKPATVAKMFTRWNLLASPHKANWMVKCVTADGRGRGEDHRHDVHPNGNLLLGLAQAWQLKVDVDELQAERKKPLVGKAIGDAVLRKRIANLAAAKADLL